MEIQLIHEYNRMHPNFYLFASGDYNNRSKALSSSVLLRIYFRLKREARLFAICAGINLTKTKTDTIWLCASKTSQICNNHWNNTLGNKLYLTTGDNHAARKAKLKNTWKLRLCQTYLLSICKGLFTITQLIRTTRYIPSLNFNRDLNSKSTILFNNTKITRTNTSLLE